MSSNQKRKTNKLKRHRIWPHIVLLVFLEIVFAILGVALLSIFMEEIIGRKMLENYRNAQQIAKIYERESDLNEIVSDMYEIKTLFPNIDTICIADKSKNIIGKYGVNQPDFSNSNQFQFFSEEMNVIIDSKDALFDFSDNNTIQLSLPALVKKTNFADFIQAINPSVKWFSEEWISTMCWFIIPYGNRGNTVCIYSDMAITNYEILQLIGIILIYAAIEVFFGVYLLFAVIKVVVDQRRTYKIINTDFVTGGNNKFAFANLGRKLLANRRKRNYAVISIELTKFSNYCAVYGEHAGETLLEKIYITLAKYLSSKELLSHFDGSEFALLLTYTDNVNLNNRVSTMMDLLVNTDTKDKLYFSAGINRCENGNDPIRYYNEAAIAKNTVKEDDEFRIRWFTDKLRAETVWERKVESDMENALQSKQFQVYLQPKYSTDSEVLSGAEALIRWIHPEEGFISPGRFIPIFERNGFVMKIDDYMISEVAKLQSEWLSQGRKLVPISVNVSRVHFIREDLAEHIRDLVDAYNVPHEFIELELTESAFFDDKEILLKTVNKMKEYGFHISMDDFGAGYSSLNSLKELPLDVVKLDAEFFRGTDDLQRANLIVAQTINLAKELGMTIVAEGIETREQVDFLADKKCDLIQGFYFAKPMPVSEFEQKAYCAE